jgi:hypothetical protein
MKKSIALILLLTNLYVSLQATENKQNINNDNSKVDDLYKDNLNSQLMKFDIKIQKYIQEKYTLEIFNKIRNLLLQNDVITAYNLFTQLKPLHTEAYKDYYYFFTVLKKFKQNKKVPEIKFITNPFLVFKFFEISIYISNNYNKIMRLIEILNYYKKHNKTHLIEEDDYNRLYSLLYKLAGSNTLSLFYMYKIKNLTKADKEKILFLYKTLIKIENNYNKLTKANLNIITQKNLEFYRISIPKPKLEIKF